MTDKIIKLLNNNRGFTLAEVLIAITLLSFMMLGMYTLIDNSTRTKETVIAEDRDMLQIETALARFEIDFSQIYSPLYYSLSKKEEVQEKKKAKTKDKEQGGDGQSATDSPPDEYYSDEAYDKNKYFPEESAKGLPIPLIDQPEKNTLIFFTTSNRRKVQDSKQSYFAWVRYALRSSTADAVNNQAPYELVRSYTANNPYGDDFDWDSLPTYVLLRNIKDLEFSFWHNKKEKHVQSIKELDDQRIIRSVQVDLKILDKQGVEFHITRNYRPLWPLFGPSTDYQQKKEDSRTNRFDEESDKGND